MSEWIYNSEKNTLTVDGVTYDLREQGGLLKHAQVGDLCLNQHGEYVQLCEINPSTLYTHKYVRKDGTVVWVDKSGRYAPAEPEHHAFDLIYWERLAPEYSAEWAWQVMQTGARVEFVKEHFHHTRYYVGGDKIMQVATGTHGAVCNNTKAEWLDYAEPEGWYRYQQEKPEPPKKFDAVRAGRWVEMRHKTNKDQTCYCRVEAERGDIFSVTPPFGDGNMIVLDKTGEPILGYWYAEREVFLKDVIIDFGCGIKGHIEKNGPSWIRVYVDVVGGGRRFIATFLIEALKKSIRKQVEALLSDLQDNPTKPC